MKLQDDTSKGFVLGEDAIKMRGGLNSKSNEIATVCDGNALSVNVLPGKEAEIPLRLRITKEGTFRISLIKSYGYGLYDRAELLDKETGMRRELLSGNDYEFYVDDTAKAESRFVLIIGSDDITTGIDQTEGNGKPSVSISGNNCRIEGLSGKSVIEIFDVAGRRCVYTTTQGGSSTHHLPQGTYIVRVQTSNKSFTNKISVR